MTAVATPPAASPSTNATPAGDKSAASLPLEVPQELLDAVVSAVKNGLSMAGIPAECVGVSKVPSRQAGELTGMIGVHGSVSGFVTVNMSERLALCAVEGLLGETYDTLTPQVIDGAGEVTNIVVGGVKSALSRTDWAFSQITVPSVVVGDGYQVAFARGIELLDVVFEVENSKAIAVNDRLLHVTLSLLKL